MLKKVVVGTSPSCQSYITYETSINSPSTINSNIHTLKNHHTKQGLSTPLQLFTKNNQTKQGLSTPLQPSTKNNQTKQDLSTPLQPSTKNNQTKLGLSTPLQPLTANLNKKHQKSREGK